MGYINVLEQHVANLIAAGEVVERPASVVKELLENSIDAGATKVTVEIKNGGVSFIRITDNGKGMEPDDVPVCIKRHATSKIHDANDLDAINTLGFRGEALAAISSVSKLRILTKTADSQLGTSLISENGNISSIEEIGCPSGTTVIVEELFANVPARRKFLKRDITEGQAVAAVVEKIALSHPEIAIKLISDGNIKFSTAGDGVLLSTIYEVLGKDYAKQLIKVDEISDGIEIRGYIGTPDYVRGNRNNQNFFLNGRYIKSSTLTAAIEQGFSSYIAPERFPCCVLNIIIHPAFVDVNVHPTKLEVRFSNERLVFNALYCAVRNAIQNNPKRPELVNDSVKRTSDNLFSSDFDLAMKTDQKSAEAEAESREKAKLRYTQIDIGRAEIERNTVTVSNIPEINGPSHKSAETAENPQISYANTPLSSENSATVKNENETIDITVPADEIKYTRESTEADIPNEVVTAQPSTQEFTDNGVIKPTYKITGVAFDCYIFVEMEDKMLIIDKHAAHERIIFEELRANMKSTVKTSQMMLIPISLSLSREEYAAVYEYAEEIKSTGFDFVTGNSGESVEMFMIPSILDGTEAATVFTKMAGELADSTGNASLNKDKIYEKALYQASCKAAMKGGVSNEKEHIQWLCDKIISLPDIKYCPHGRPVAFEMTKRQFENRFGRT